LRDDGDDGGPWPSEFTPQGAYTVDKVAIRSIQRYSCTQNLKKKIGINEPIAASNKITMIPLFLLEGKPKI
jgi:hypothetical protein